jgi:hypothetical protein
MKPEEGGGWKPEEGGASGIGSGPFHTLVGKALIDPEYRERLQNPDTQAEALKEAGIHNPSDVQIQALKNAIAAVSTLSGSFGDEVGAA